jgi:hypothetical protein
MSNQPLITALRYIVSALGAIIAALVALGYMAQSDAEKIGKLLEQLSQHGGALVGVIGALLTAASTAYGAYKASNAAHVKRVEQTPGVTLVVTNADTAPAAAVAAADDPNRTKVELSPDARRDNEHA